MSALPPIATSIAADLSGRHGPEIKSNAKNCSQANEQRHAAEDFISPLSLLFPPLMLPVPFFDEYLCGDWTGV
jgi:hypothetical protein